MRLLTSLLLLLTLLIGCSKPSSQEENKTVATADSTESIELNDQKVALSEIRTGSLKERTIAHSINCNGYIEVPPQSRMTVSIPYNCVVRRLNVTIGSTVSAGQTIAQIDHPQLIDLQSSYLSARATYEVESKEYARQSILSKEKIASDKTYQESKNRYIQAQTTLQATSAALQAIGIEPNEVEQHGVRPFLPIKAPLGGIISVVNVNLGKSVAAGEPIFEIIDKRTMSLNLRVFENNLAHIVKNDHVNFYLTHNPAEQFSAKVSYVGERVDAENRSVLVVAAIDKISSELKVGMYVNATLYTQALNALCLPETAFVNRNNKWYIFLNYGRRYEQFEVLKGGETEGFVEVLNANKIPKDAKIVVSGAYYVETEMQKDLD